MQYLDVMMKEESINQKDVITKLALDWFVQTDKRNIVFDLGWIDIFEAGYKAATKIYTKENIEDAFNAGRGYGVPDDIKDLNIYIQSLNRRKNET